jgi:hypothetical protein
MRFLPSLHDNKLSRRRSRVRPSLEWSERPGKRTRDRVPAEKLGYILRQGQSRFRTGEPGQNFIMPEIRALKQGAVIAGKRAAVKRKTRLHALQIFK